LKGLLSKGVLFAPMPTVYFGKSINERDLQTHHKRYSSPPGRPILGRLRQIGQTTRVKIDCCRDETDPRGKNMLSKGLPPFPAEMIQVELFRDKTVMAKHFVH
jgi:hypothetical protein